VRRHLAALAALVLWVAAVACGTATTSRQPAGLGGSDDAGTIEASSPADGGGDDATSPIDALPKVAPDASQWCVTQPSPFCDDFDEDPLAQGWDEVAAQHGAIALDDGSYATPARSALAQVDALPAGGSAYARLAKRVAQITTDMTYAFDVRLDAVDPSAPVVVAAIGLADSRGVTFETVDVWLGATSSSVDEYASDGDGGVLTRSHPFAPVPLGAWTRIALELTLPLDAGLGAGLLTVHVGGDATPPVVDRAPMLDVSQPGFPAVYLGVVAAGPSTPAAVRYDDVTFDFVAL